MCIYTFFPERQLLKIEPLTTTLTKMEKKWRNQFVEDYHQYCRFFLHLKAEISLSLGALLISFVYSSLGIAVF